MSVSYFNLAENKGALGDELFLSYESKWLWYEK
jgi:hypothetical protein